jgi:DNA-binding MarR family transcriptional regulator
MPVKGPPKRQREATVEDDLGELASLLGQTFRALKSTRPPPPALHDAAESGDLGKRHLPALLAVTLAGPLSVSELAKRLGLGLSTTSTIVGQLNRAGLLDRAEDDEDRRRTIVRLHDDYREAMSAWTQEALAPLRRTLERLPPRSRASFMEGWRILHQEASQHSDANGVSEACDDA